MPRYPLIHRLLHSAVAVLIAFVLAVGFVFMFLEFDGVLSTFGEDTTNLLYTYHKSFGVLLLVLMIARLGTRLAFGKPEYRPPLDALERRLSAAVHAGLYVALFVQPLIGWAATAAGGYPIQFFGWVLPGFLPKDPPLSSTLYDVHGVVGWMILLLAGLHIAGALRHWLVIRDGVMTRISLP